MTIDPDHVSSTTAMVSVQVTRMSTKARFWNVVVMAITTLITVFTVRETSRHIERPKEGFGNMLKEYP